jgi:signal transduction histidine kinase
VKLYLEAIEDGIMQLDAKMICLLTKELSRLIEITEKIMKYEQFSSNTFQDIRVERFEYAKVAYEIIEEYQIQLEKTGQKVVCEFAENTLTRMDKNMCVQILHNIFSNFIKYAGNSTTLTCSYKKSHDGYYILTFGDNGKGIDEKERAYVKEKFYRLDKGRTQKDGSMGIGLSIIDQIAKLHK